MNKKENSKDTSKFTLSEKVDAIIALDSKNIINNSRYLRLER